MDNIVETTFKPNSSDVSHLQWIAGFLTYHVDLEYRKVLVVNENDWKFQFKDEDEINLTKDLELEIPANKFHKLIKGTTDLVVKIQIGE